jgi:hypothetical protein
VKGIFDWFSSRSFSLLFLSQKFKGEINMVSLFDFDVEVLSYSEEEIAEKWEMFTQSMKKRGNYHNEGSVMKELGIQSFQESFVEHGYMTYKGDRYHADRTKLVYHTVDEVLEEFDEIVEALLANPYSNNTFKGGAGWLLPMPCNLSHSIEIHRQMQQKIYEAIKPYKKRVAMTLGLDYYLANPNARGTKMNIFTEKAYKRQFIPFFIELVKPITDYDEMNDLLRNHIFCFGRRDWFFGNVAYQNLGAPTFTDLQIAVLCQTEDTVIILEILSHCGGSYGHGDTSKKILYPPTFTHQDYLDSLTDEDIGNIFDDMERLNRFSGEN